MKKILFIAVLLSHVCLPTEVFAESGSVKALHSVSSEMNAVQYLNINTASVTELTRLPGIGVKKAQAIVAHRTEHGAFVTKEELTEVKGINVKLLAKIESRIRVQ